MNKIHGEVSQGSDLICTFYSDTMGMFCACDAPVVRVKRKTWATFFFCVCGFWEIVAFVFVAFESHNSLREKYPSFPIMQTFMMFFVCLLKVLSPHKVSNLWGHKWHLSSVGFSSSSQVLLSFAIYDHLCWFLLIVQKVLGSTSVSTKLNPKGYKES